MRDIELQAPDQDFLALTETDSGAKADSCTEADAEAGEHYINVHGDNALNKDASWAAPDSNGKRQNMSLAILRNYIRAAPAGMIRINVGGGNSGSAIYKGLVTNGDLITMLNG